MGDIDFVAEEVADKVFGWEHATDCFCGHGGKWPSTTEGVPDGWRNNGVVIDYIVQAVQAKLEDDAGALAAARAKVELAEALVDATKDGIRKRVSLAEHPKKEDVTCEA